MATEGEVSKAPWELFYWAQVKEDGRNHMIGRGEFVRLMFEAAGVPYIDHGVKDMAEVVKFVRGGGNEGFPIFAPPAIRKGGFVMNQTPSIVRFLGKEFGLYPSTKEGEAHADALNSFVTDFVAEGRLVFHPKCFTMSYFQQVDEARPYIAWFETERMPKFLAYLESVLAYNEKQGVEGGFFVGDALTYVDIAVFHTLEAAASQFPEGYAKQVADKAIPRLEAFRERIAAVPRIAHYLASDRRGFFEGNSMM
jgi:glutathione S-transferase